LENQIWDAMNTRLSAYEIPKSIIFTDKIQITKNGKILRKPPVT